MVGNVQLSNVPSGKHHVGTALKVLIYLSDTARRWPTKQKDNTFIKQVSSNSLYHQQPEFKLKNIPTCLPLQITSPGVTYTAPQGAQGLTQQGVRCSGSWQSGIPCSALRSISHHQAHFQTKCQTAAEKGAKAAPEDRAAAVTYYHCCILPAAWIIIIFNLLACEFFSFAA